MKPVKQRRLGAEAWRALLAKFADSGLGVHAFCGQEDISPSSFRRWRRQLDGSSTEQPPRKRNAIVSASKFVALGTLSAGAAAPGERCELRLDLGGGLVLHLVRG
jgi:transposase-like protein